MRTVVEREELITEPRQSYIVGTIARVFDYLFGALYTLLFVRLVLEFFNARPSAGFVQFIRSLSDFFYSPFKGIVGTTTIGEWHLVWPLVIAILAYMLLHALIRGALSLIARA
jgi:hypothetical protein